MERRVVRTKLIIAALAVACGWSARAANFSNLNFEAYAGTGDDLLPGWERSTNDYIWPLMDGYPLVTSGLGLTSYNYPGVGGPLEGHYTAFFSTGFGGDVAIWQTAKVSTQARYIQFLTIGIDNATLGGISLAENVPDLLPNNIFRYTTDIRTLAGQNVTLQFTADNGMIYNEEEQYIVGANWYWLDQIVFLNAAQMAYPSPPPICLEDFHASTVNTNMWRCETAAEPCPQNVRQADGCLYFHARASNNFQALWHRYLPALSGDWDVSIEYIHPSLAHAGGIAFGAEFEDDGNATASVQYMLKTGESGRWHAMDFGGGPTNDVAVTNTSGAFRLTRTGDQIEGFFWNAKSNRWQSVGASNGYPTGKAHVGLKLWSDDCVWAGLWADNLILWRGMLTVGALAIREFAVDADGAPSVTWGSGGIPESNCYFVTRATSLVDSVWTPVSGAIGDSGGETNWTGPGGGAGPAYYRIEVAPSAPGP